MPKQRDLISASACARELGISTRTVRRYCEAGRIRGAYKLGWAWLIPAPPTLLPNSQES